MGAPGLAEQAENQDEVLAFLADAAAHGGERPQRIDTHAASVFLAGDRALKIKRCGALSVSRLFDAG